MIRTSSTNTLRRVLIRKLLRLSKKDGRRIWARVAEELARPRRRRRAVNISRINRYAKEDEIAVVPGRVLGSGMLTKSLTIVAESFSLTALDKITKAGGKPITLRELVEKEEILEHIKGKRFVLIG